MKIFSIVLFVVMVVAQWFVPISMINDSEATRVEGKMFRFETRPVDPTDPFRGKYITLNYILSSYETDVTHLKDATEVFVTVASDDNGVAKIIGVSKSRPANTSNYFKAKVDDVSDNTIYMTFPFERFYLEESKASAAETVYNENNRNEERNPAYAEVYILNGNVYLDDVKIGGESVVDIVRKTNKNNLKPRTLNLEP